MKTMTAQRLKKQVEHELKNRGEMLDHLFEEARAEAEKLATLLSPTADKGFDTIPRQTYEEYREDNEESYFEQGVIER
jgi:hypothetical protein